MAARFATSQRHTVLIIPMLDTHLHSTTYKHFFHLNFVGSTLYSDEQFDTIIYIITTWSE